MAKDNSICFGPFIAERKSGGDFPRFRNTGVAMEFASTIGTTSTIYKRLWPDSPDVALFGLGDFFIHQSELPCEVRCFDYSTQAVAGGKLIPLEDALLSLYRKYAMARPLRFVLEELREKLGPAVPSKVPPPNLLLAQVAAAGFRTDHVFPYGRTLTVSIKWAPIADIGQPSFCAVSLGYIEFKPERDRTLGKGAWMKPRVDILGMILRSDLASMVKGPPIKLFSPEGSAELIATFPWKPISLLTRKELDEAKVKFIHEHPELHNNLSGLAKALIQAGYYSEGSGRSLARKFALKVLQSVELSGTSGR